MNEQNIGVNYAAAEFRRDLVDRMNASGLPVCIVRMIFAELTSQLYKMEQAQIEQERTKYQSGQQPTEAE